MSRLGLHAAAALLLPFMLLAAVPPTEDQAGFLDPAEFDVVRILEPAPVKGDPRYEADRRIFRATRKLRGTPRWQLAIDDGDLSVPALMKDFSCAVGVELTVGNAPGLARLVRKASIDTDVRTVRAKQTFRRARPFTIDRGPVCRPTSELFDTADGRMSYDYPSGHTTRGWTWAFVLTAAVPERAQAILERGRAYGESRFVCGAHNESAVEAGMRSAAATMAVVSTKPGYQAALANVRRELAALRAGTAPPAQGCLAEQRFLAQRVMPAFTR